MKEFLETYWLIPYIILPLVITYFTRLMDKLFPAFFGRFIPSVFKLIKTKRRIRKIIKCREIIKRLNIIEDNKEMLSIYLSKYELNRNIGNFFLASSFVILVLYIFFPPSFTNLEEYTHIYFACFDLLIFWIGFLNLYSNYELIILRRYKMKKEIKYKTVPFHLLGNHNDYKKFMYN